MRKGQHPTWEPKVLSGFVFSGEVGPSSMAVYLHVRCFFVGKD